MDSEIAEQILEELVPTFQNLETQSAAVVQFLKDKGLAKDDELAPYLEQAAKASSVRWRAARVRMARLLAATEKTADKKKEEPEISAKEPDKPASGHSGTQVPKTAAEEKNAQAKASAKEHEASEQQNRDSEPQGASRFRDTDVQHKNDRTQETASSANEKVEPDTVDPNEDNTQQSRQTRPDRTPAEPAQGTPKRSETNRGSSNERSRKTA